jgi:hypothetical protein
MVQTSGLTFRRRIGAESHGAQPSQAQHRGVWVKEEESGSFLKKRTKKLLRTWAEPYRVGRSPNVQKFFASFFQKRSPRL